MIVNIDPAEFASTIEDAIEAAIRRAEEGTP